MHHSLSGIAFRLAAVVVAASTSAGSVCLAASPTQLLGSLVGSVADNSGIPQMGAVVKLYNRQERFLEQAVTAADGGFRFSALIPGLYSVRVSLSSFVPAIHKNITVQPGMQSVLAVNMATLLSSVELVYTSRSPGTLMSDDWKWVLRSTMTTRPVTRILPGVDMSDPNTAAKTATAVFSDTRGVLKVSAGESANPFTSAGSQPDLGTTFALATSLFGNNHVQFSGNFGYALNSDLPAAGFRTSFSRPGASPEVKLTVQQVGLAGFRGSPLIGQTGNAPLLRTMSVTVFERAEPMEGVELDYGASLDSVTYMDRLNYISPFARLRYRIGPGTLDLGYSSGAPPVELLNRDVEDASLQNDIAALAMLPRVSLRGGHAEVQRTQNIEIGYRVASGSRVYSVGAYHEFVRNAAVTMSAPAGELFNPMDTLPELSSNSSVFNIGDYSRSGLTFAVTQQLDGDWAATLAAGRGGVLTTTGTDLPSTEAVALREMIHRTNRLWIRGMLTGTVPVTGTRFVSSYEWSDATTLTPGHVYLTQKIYPETGLNVRLRQPLPWSGLGGRFEATAELRNLLAQGYLPVTPPGGRRLVLAHFPRAVRGGVSFIF